MVKESFPQDGEGNYTFGNKRLKTVHDPSEPQDASTKKYVDTVSENREKNMRAYITEVKESSNQLISTAVDNVKSELLVAVEKTQDESNQYISSAIAAVKAELLGELKKTKAVLNERQKERFKEFISNNAVGVMSVALATIPDQPEPVTSPYLLSNGDTFYEIPVTGWIAKLVIITLETDGVFSGIQLRLNEFALTMTGVSNGRHIGTKSTAAGVPIPVKAGDRLSFFQEEDDIPKHRLHITIDLRYKLV